MMVTEATIASVTFMSGEIKMALAAVLAETKKTAKPKGSKIDVLLERLKAESKEDHDTLLAALNDPEIRDATLTKAVKTEYGADVLSNTSVREYRMKMGLR